MVKLPEGLVALLACAAGFLAPVASQASADNDGCLAPSVGFNINLSDYPVQFDGKMPQKTALTVSQFPLIAPEIAIDSLAPDAVVHLRKDAPVIRGVYQNFLAGLVEHQHVEAIARLSATSTTPQLVFLIKRQQVSSTGGLDLYQWNEREGPGNLHLTFYAWLRPSDGTIVIVTDRALMLAALHPIANGKRCLDQWLQSDPKDNFWLERVRVSDVPKMLALPDGVDRMTATYDFKAAVGHFHLFTSRPIDLGSILPDGDATRLFHRTADGYAADIPFSENGTRGALWYQLIGYLGFPIAA